MTQSVDSEEMGGGENEMKDARTKRRKTGRYGVVAEEQRGWVRDREDIREREIERERRGRGGGVRK